MKIGPFRGPFGFLSNFYRCKLVYKGRRFPTVEHAFIWEKLNRQHYDEIVKLTAGQAKRFGRQHPMREDWATPSVAGRQPRITVMYDLCWAKFNQNLWLRDKLLDTYPHEIVEFNDWKDFFWGVDKATGRGANTLGRILMSVRRQLMTPALPGVPPKGVEAV